MNHLRAIFCNSAPLELPADHESGDILKKDERNFPEIAQLQEMRGLQRGLREQHTAIVRHNPHEKTVNARKPGDEGCAVPGFELVESGTVDHTRQNLANVVGTPDVGIDDAVEVL